MPAVQLIAATTPARLEMARELFREYAAEIQVDLCFQEFESELRDLPGRYAGPLGCLLLARSGTDWIGSVAVRAFDPETAEMKRLYVRPAWRGTGVGRRLATAAVDHARAAGFRRMRLDTLDTMHAAGALYRRMGFRESPAYYTNPLPNPVYMELDLRRSAAGSGSSVQFPETS